MAALSLSAVSGLKGKSGITKSAYLLIALVLSSESSSSGLDLDDTSASSSKSKNEMKGGLLLDVVVSEGSAILELLTGEDKSLLVRGDSLLILDLSLNVVDGIGSLDIKSDGLSGQSLYEDLHIVY